MKWKSIEWWWINLSSRPDRREHAEKEFAKAGIKAERFEAFMPDQWPGPEKMVAKMRATTPGAIGCYQSQTEVIRTVLDTDRIVAVCEDDICFCSDMPKRLEYIAEHLTWDWDIFYLGATFHVPGVWCHHKDCENWGTIGVDAKPTPDPHIMRVYGQWGTYSYLVNGRNARKVLDLFDANIHRARGIDHLCIILGNRLNAYCFVPGCAWQYDNLSDIGHGVTLFSGFKKLGPYAWTEKMTDFDPRWFDWQTGEYHAV